MIARTWHGVVPESKADDYFEYLKKTGVPGYESTKGNRGIYILRRTENFSTHYLLITLWDSLESIRAFAGENAEQARHYPEDDEYLLEREPLCTHYEVLMSPGRSV
ncbi:antibiotic biosynthesis monooxygenase family protein [candidate division KSB1 bacterium]